LSCLEVTYLYAGLMILFMTWYPTPERVIELNALAICVIAAKKADTHEVLSRQKIVGVLDECEDSDADGYGKAAILMEGLIRAHAFASANRRTAFLAAKEFLEKNGKTMQIPDSEQQARVMTGIREGYYGTDEVARWMEHGIIRKFER